jgi:FkbM family methyltransferase
MELKKIPYYGKRLLIKMGFNFASLFKKTSYSQCGEDILIAKIFDELNITPTYLDIGAHHPYFLSNTALFYKNGCRGINVEPDPSLFSNFKKYRKGDINLNVGIGAEVGESDFYIMSNPVLNTFSKTEASKYEKENNFKIKSITKIKNLTIKDVIDKYANGVFPDLLTLDAEGLDEVILNSIDFNTTSPIVICVESISFSTKRKGKKNNELILFLESKGYLLYADTNINSILVKKSIWEQ